jgi:hypothetical protein
MARILPLSLDGLIFLVVVDRVPADCYVRLYRNGEGFTYTLVPGRTPRNRREKDYTEMFGTKQPEIREWSNEPKEGEHRRNDG